MEFMWNTLFYYRSKGKKKQNSVLSSKGRRGKEESRPITGKDKFIGGELQV